MAGKLRVQYPGAIYHVMSRGDHCETVFRDGGDPELISNHFHLVVETPRGNLVPGMKWLLGTYTSRFDRKHKLFGHLFFRAL